jgi:hypothetical protein
MSSLSAGGFRTGRRDAKKFPGPGGRNETARAYGKELGVEPNTMRVRIKKWGTDDPRTWMTAKEAQEEAYKRRAFTRTDQETYESPCGEYSGTPGEIAKMLGTKRQNFLAKKRRFGVDDLRTWMHCWQAELYRVYRMLWQKKLDCSKWEKRLLETYRRNGLRVVMVEGVPVLK